MKKLIVILMFTLCFLTSSTFALSPQEKVMINQVNKAFEDYISKKGEKNRDIMIRLLQDPKLELQINEKVLDEILKNLETNRPSKFSSVSFGEYKQNSQSISAGVSANLATEEDEKTERYLVYNDRLSKEISLISEEEKNYTNPSNLEINSELQKLENENNSINESNVHRPVDTTIENISNFENGDLIKYDLAEVTNFWLKLHNDVRNEMGLKSYSKDNSLTKTAEIWSEVLAKRGNASHERTIGEGYYNYANIEKWFKNNGVVCKNDSRATFSESLGWRQFSCQAGADCTTQIKDSMQKTFDFFMSEKSYNGAHYRAVVHNKFQFMGVGVRVQNVGGNSYKTFLTTHYCTENTL